MNIREERARILFGSFVKCPTTNRVLGVLPGDDKVICGCRQSNPKLPQEETHRTGTHVARFLRTATAAEYVEQCEADDVKHRCKECGASLSSSLTARNLPGYPSCKVCGAVVSLQKKEQK